MKNNSRGLLASSFIPKSSNKRDSLLQEFMDNEEDLVYEDFEKLSAGEQFKQIKGFHFFLYHYLSGKDIFILNQDSDEYSGLIEYCNKLLKRGRSAEQEDLIGRFKALGVDEYQ